MSKISNVALQGTWRRVMHIRMGAPSCEVCALSAVPDKVFNLTATCSLLILFCLKVIKSDREGEKKYRMDPDRRNWEFSKEHFCDGGMQDLLTGREGPVRVNVALLFSNYKIKQNAKLKTHYVIFIEPSVVHKLWPRHNCSILLQ